jgi:hypothetical protein
MNDPKQNGGTMVEEKPGASFNVPEGDLFLFVRVNLEKNEMQVLVRDPITGRGLAQLASDYLRVQFEDSLRAQQQPQVALPRGLDMSSLTRAMRKVGKS